ncbi:hypothetical protein BLX88_25135, partial [Bacillus obstructivus]
TEHEQMGFKTLLFQFAAGGIGDLLGAAERGIGNQHCRRLFSGGIMGERQHRRSAEFLPQDLIHVRQGRQPAREKGKACE